MPIREVPGYLAHFQLSGCSFSLPMQGTSSASTQFSHLVHNPLCWLSFPPCFPIPLWKAKVSPTTSTVAAISAKTKHHAKELGRALANLLGVLSFFSFFIKISVQHKSKQKFYLLQTLHSSAYFFSVRTVLGRQNNLALRNCGNSMEVNTRKVQEVLIIEGDCT